MPSSERGDVEEGAVGTMPSSERPGEKKGGASERLTGKEGEERGKARRRSSMKDAIVLDWRWPLDTETADRPQPLDAKRRQLWRRTTCTTDASA